MKTYVLFTFHTQIKFNRRKYNIVVIPIFSEVTPMSVLKSLETHLPRFWPSYATVCGSKIIQRLCQREVKWDNPVSCDKKRLEKMEKLA